MLNLSQVNVARTEFTLNELYSYLLKQFKTKAPMSSGCSVVVIPAELMVFTKSQAMEMFVRLRTSHSDVPAVERVTEAIEVGTSSIKVGKLVVISPKKDATVFKLQSGYLVERIPGVTATRTKAEQIKAANLNNCVLASRLVDALLVQTTFDFKSGQHCLRNVGAMPESFRLPLLDFISEGRLCNKVFAESKSYQDARQRLYDRLRESPLTALVVQGVMGETACSAGKMSPAFVYQKDATENELKGMDLAVKNRLIDAPKTKMFTMVPPMCADLTKLSPKINELCDWFWRDLASRHRVYRGEGRKVKNLPFAGYYFGAVNQQIETVMWEVGDLVKISERCGKIVMREHNMSMAAIQSLPSNGISVFFPLKRMCGIAQDLSAPGIYSSFEGERTVVVFDQDLSLTEKPIVYKNCVKYYGKLKSTKYLEAVKDWCNGSEVKFGLFYLNTILLTQFLDHLVPSLHVHAGHVLMCSKPMDVKIPDLASKLICRAIKANYYKTYFPYSRQVYGFVDPFRPEQAFKFRQVEKFVDDDFRLVLEDGEEGSVDPLYDYDESRLLDEVMGDESIPIDVPKDVAPLIEIVPSGGSTFTFGVGVKPSIEPGEVEEEETSDNPLNQEAEVDEEETFDVGEDA